MARGSGSRRPHWLDDSCSPLPPAAPRPGKDTAEGRHFLGGGEPRLGAVSQKHAEKPHLRIAFRVTSPAFSLKVGVGTTAPGSGSHPMVGGCLLRSFAENRMKENGGGRVRASSLGRLELYSRN